MNYELAIKDVNVEAHLDIEKEIAARRNGQMTFTLRVNNGNIADLVVVQYVDARQYLRLKSVTLEELTVAYNPHERTSPDALRPINSKL